MHEQAPVIAEALHHDEHPRVQLAVASPLRSFGTGVTVQFFVDGVAGEVMTTAQLAPGGRETVEFVLETPLSAFVVEAEVDTPGAINECNESNKARSKTICVPAG